MDGSSYVDGFGAGLILTSPEGTEFTYTLRFQFAASNNEAEYEALIAGLRIAAQMGVQNVHVSVDSKLVANQVLGTYVAKEKNMIKYLEKVKSLVSGFTNFSISHVPRSKNKKADALSKIASTSVAHLSKQVLVEILKEKYIKEKEVTTVVEEDGPTWMTSIMEYLIEGTIFSDRKEARKLRIKARQYKLLEGVLYRRSFLTPWLRCVGPLQGGIHCPITSNPQQPLTSNTALLLFYKWGINIAGPFPEGPGEGIKARLGEGNKNWIEELPHVLWAHRTMIKSSHGDTPFSLTYGTKAVIPAKIRMPTYRTVTMDVVYNDEELRLNLDLLEERRKRVAIREAKSNLKMTNPFPKGPCKVNFLIVAMDYFTKWIEATAVATITSSQVKKFVWDNIVCRFGIKARLGEGNKNWVEELPHVLWAHRTMIKSSHGNKPFSLTYGTEAVIPAKIRMPTYRTATVDVVYNDEELRLNMDLLKERCERATIHEAKANLKMIKYYNARVRDVLSTAVMTPVMLWKEGS
nr:reverse transcriptase domain-containing protein [Tanacetum cinerariifolium]